MKKLNVLLVEDDLVVQRVHEHMLTRLGCTVDIVATGKAAVEKVDNDSSYHVIFVDIGLPDISGFDVIRHLHSLNKKNLTNTSIVALTGFAGEEERLACLSAGVAQVLHKPIVNSAMREFLSQYK